MDSSTKQEQWIGNVAATIKFNKHLSFKSAATYNTNYQRRDNFYHETTSNAYRAGGPFGETTMARNKRWQISNTLTYQNRFKKKHNLNLMLGHESAGTGYESLLGQSKDFPFENFGTDNLGLGATPSKVNTHPHKEYAPFLLCKRLLQL